MSRGGEIIGLKEGRCVKYTKYVTGGCEDSNTAQIPLVWIIDMASDPAAASGWHEVIEF
jgi:hypothetical protein